MRISILGAPISFALFILSLGLPANALRMNNSQYIIQSEINSFGGKATGTAGTVTFSGGQSPGLYSGTNYKVRAGFQYIYSIIPFAFSISTTDINFGTLVPGEPVTRDNILTVSNESATGYQVTLEQDHPLRISSTNTDIPDTTCDAGNCSYTTAAAWTSPLTYGFGYRCDNVSGSDCSPSFATANSYKQFASKEAGESAQVVMSSTNVGRNRQGKITYKINISASQLAGIYQNIIKYIATPSI
ncbi:MAG: hypothetical protein A2868_04110 [Candidatus Levybacteria bacterium RIFCSPHIGHO2_01_FULL_40_15b]|nr:MAG: hypothetical protein A2868_04110 [Candidatus Levybacteria bacterium RIFCSPHIGHO2_01_FULL_40_15b]